MAVDMAALSTQFASVIEAHVGSRIFNEVLVEVIESDEETTALAEATAREVCGTTWGHEMRPHQYASEIGRSLVQALDYGTIEGERVSGRVLAAFLDCIDVTALGMYCMRRVGLEGTWQAWPLPERKEQE